MNPCPQVLPGVDFQAAISRRRATVDGDGETFESTPSVKSVGGGSVGFVV
jgi:hypothetical protein